MPSRAPRRTVTGFVLDELPAPPAAVLEIGCGDGKLAIELAETGYLVTAIDPVAPEGPLFRQIGIEDLDESARFDAVVANRSLHHIADLDAAIEKIGVLLRPGAALVVQEFARERLEERTARWYYHVRQALTLARGNPPLAEPFEEWWGEWKRERAHLHTGEEVRVALAERFDERLFAWSACLYRWKLDEAVEPLEEKLIDEGAIEATGFRYVGVPRSGPLGGSG